MIHDNGNLLCVIDTETTGLNPMYHSIWQFACVPLDFRLDPHPTIGPIELILQPVHKTFDRKAISQTNFDRAMTTGMDSCVAGELFNEWFERLPIGHMKRISVLGQNWPFDREFVKAWLGHENFHYYFDGRFRDTMALAMAISDSQDFNAEKRTFYRLNLRTLANQLGIHWDTMSAHNALYDAYKTAEVYKKMVNILEFIGGGSRLEH